MTFRAHFSPFDSLILTNKGSFKRFFSVWLFCFWPHNAPISEPEGSFFTCFWFIYAIFYCLCPFFHLLSSLLFSLLFHLFMPVFLLITSPLCLFTPTTRPHFPVLLSYFTIVSRETSRSWRCLFAFCAKFCGFGVVSLCFTWNIKVFGVRGRGRVPVLTICVNYPFSGCVLRWLWLFHVKHSLFGGDAVG